MGHVMQPTIGRLAQDKLKIELKDADYAITHPKEGWLRSHFDFISADGKTLVEAKNYNAAVRNKFDSEAGIIPVADMAQLIHHHGIMVKPTQYLVDSEEMFIDDRTYPKEILSLACKNNRKYKNCNRRSLI
jgi:hypothetical protein